MRVNEQINSVKKEIKDLEDELNESSAQLGGVFYDSGTELYNSSLVGEIDDLEAKIPEIKSRMKALQSYNLSISESEDKIKECNIKIKELEQKNESVLEKVGVELYCFIGEKELSYSGISGIYNELKKGELRSETLENSLYKYENNSVKKGFSDIITKPFKVKSIKREIKQNNKESLGKFKDLGRAYSEIPQLIDDETNESLLDILEDYNAINKSLRLQKDSEHNLKRHIAENEEKIQEGSNGVRLKTLYSKLEQEILLTQERISKKLIQLGSEVAAATDLDIDSHEILIKLEKYNLINSNIANKNEELHYYETKAMQNYQLIEITDKKSSIKREEEYLKSLEDKLKKSKEELAFLISDSESRAKWLEENSVDD